VRDSSFLAAINLKLLAIKVVEKVHLRYPYMVNLIKETFELNLVIKTAVKAISRIS